MSASNGTATDLREQLREQRIKNRLTVEQLKGRRLDRARRLLEANYDWVVPYVNMLELYRREPTVSGPAQIWQRKRGRNYPIFQNETELGIYRSGARVLCATNSYAIGMQEGINSFVLGTGVVYRVVKQPNAEPPDELIQVCQQTLDEFLDREQWYGGEMPGIEDELGLRSREDGEWFLHHIADDAGLTSVRIIEPEQVTEPIDPEIIGERDDDQEPYDWSFGIKTRKDDVQKPLGYYVVWGDTITDGEVIGADDIIHYRRNSRRGIKRGLTDYCFDTYDSFNLGGLLRTNMSDAAAQQAAIVGVRQHATATEEQIESFNLGTQDTTRTNPTSGGSESVRKYERGHWEDIDKGQAYVPGPLAQNQPIHIQVLQACLRGGAVRWNAPEWLVSGLHDTSSFASSLTAESPFTRRILREQRSTCAAHRGTMLRVLKNRADARQIVVKGEVWTWDKLKKFIDVKAEAQSPQMRNNLEDAQVAAIEIPLGVDSRQQYTQRKGREYADVEKDNADYIESTGGSGMPLVIPGDIPGPAKELRPEPNGVTGKGPALPDVRQESSFDCGPAALRCVLDHYGIRRSQDSLIQALGTTAEDGTDLQAMIDYAIGAGLQVARVSNATVADLHRITAWNWPCIVPMQWTGSRPQDVAQIEAGHYVVVFGVKEGAVQYQDPLKGPRQLPESQFAQLWIDKDADGSVHRRVLVGLGPPQAE